MRAWRLTGWKHDPEFAELPEPEPGAGEVLVRVGGAGACHSDLHLMHDFEDGLMPWNLPFTLGHENAGWVERLGAGVSGLEVGQPVAVYGSWGCGHCRRCALGMENYCEHQADIGAYGGGLGLDGGMAPFMVAHARHLVPLTDISPVHAAPLTDAGLTPYHAVKRSLELLVPGSTAVVIGAGGLGHMAIQILTALSPAAVVAVDQNPDALALARDLGASHGVLASEHAAEEIRDITRGPGAELVLDVVGADTTLALGAAVTRPLGHLTLVGLAGGSIPFSFFSQAYEVSLATTYWGTLPELMEVISLAEAGHIRAHVQEFSLDDAPRAYEAVGRGELHGRAVIVPAT